MNKLHVHSANQAPRGSSRYLIRITRFKYNQYHVLISNKLYLLFVWTSLNDADSTDFSDPSPICDRSSCGTRIITPYISCFGTGYNVSTVNGGVIRREICEGFYVYRLSEAKGIVRQLSIVEARK